MSLCIKCRWLIRGSHIHKPIDIWIKLNTHTKKKKNSKEGQRIISPPGGKFKERTMKGIYRHEYKNGNDLVESVYN